jgi:hypothetical protein
VLAANRIRLGLSPCNQLDRATTNCSSTQVSPVTPHHLQAAAGSASASQGSAAAAAAAGCSKIQALLAKLREVQQEEQQVRG